MEKLDTAKGEKMNHSFASRIAEWWRQPVNCAIAVLLVIYAIGLGLHMQAYGAALIRRAT